MAATGPLFCRFHDRSQDASGRPLYWYRADLDGAPIRGVTPPLHLKQAEFEDQLVRVAEPRAELFDISDPAQKQAYLSVLDGVANGWYQLVYIRRPGEYDPERRSLAYVEWIEFYMELPPGFTSS